MQQQQKAQVSREQLAEMRRQRVLAAKSDRMERLTGVKEEIHLPTPPPPSNPSMVVVKRQGGAREWWIQVVLLLWALLCGACSYSKWVCLTPLLAIKLPTLILNRPSGILDALNIALGTLQLVKQALDLLLFAALASYSAA
jgi:hypothetical protein